MFKTIPSCERYEASALGEIRHKKSGRLLKPFSSGKTAYLRVSIWLNGKIKQKLVHRIVAEAWLSNPSQFPQVNHLDGNKRNNAVSNLEWTTCAGNTEHAFRSGLRKGPRGETCGSAILTEAKVLEIKKLLSKGLTAPAIGRMFGVNKDTVYSIKYRKTWSWL